MSSSNKDEINKNITKKEENVDENIQINENKFTYDEMENDIK